MFRTSVRLCRLFVVWSVEVEVVQLIHSGLISSNICVLLWILEWCGSKVVNNAEAILGWGVVCIYIYIYLFCFDNQSDGGMYP